MKFSLLSLLWLCHSIDARIGNSTLPKKPASDQVPDEDAYDERSSFVDTDTFKGPSSTVDGWEYDAEEPLAEDLVETKELADEEYDVMNPLDDQEQLSNLERCFMYNYNTFYHDDAGSPVSNIPVSEEIFKEGFFLQDSTDESCVLDENGKSTNPSCFQVGSTYCESCIFNVTMSEATFSNYTGDLPAATFHPCRNEISIIAEKCKETDCIQVRPTVKQILHIFPTSTSELSDTNTTANVRRNLLIDSNVLGNDKKRWMTKLQQSLRSGAMGRLTLRDFVLPGSHNSAATRMDSNWCGNEGYHLVQAGRNKVAKCQEEWGGLTKQLEEGIRYLDLRVVDSANFHGRRYPLHHVYLIDSDTKTMDDALREMVSFVEKNPDEFVIARIMYRDCDNDNFSYGGFKEEFENYTKLYSRIEKYTRNTINMNLEQLRGKIFIDINGHHKVTYAEGRGVDGPEYNSCDGNPFEVARYIRDKKSESKKDEFNLWAFFPAASAVQLLFVNAEFLCDGLEDWDANFQKHVWLMHSLMVYYGSNVNAIIRDRALTHKNIYHQATQLTLYRVFDKIHQLWPEQNGWNKVVTHEYVNEWDEKFEHKCPLGWVLSGFQSRHNNHREDRIWKFACTRAVTGSLKSRSFWWDGDRALRYDTPHESIWYRNSDRYTLNSWDGTLVFGSSKCVIAITGMGGIHNNHKEDRRFWFHASEVMGSHSSQCIWTGWVNNHDEEMNFEVGDKQYVSGIYSVHNNKHEDRMWQFCVCDSHHSQHS